VDPDCIKLDMVFLPVIDLLNSYEPINSNLNNMIISIMKQHLIIAKYM